MKLCGTGKQMHRDSQYSQCKYIEKVNDNLSYKLLSAKSGDHMSFTEGMPAETLGTYYCVLYFVIIYVGSIAKGKNGLFAIQKMITTKF